MIDGIVADPKRLVGEGNTLESTHERLSCVWREDIGPKESMRAFPS
jgi:hypothetical protein